MDALVLLADRDPRIVEALEVALRRERLRPERVGEVDGVVDLVRRLRPDAVVVGDGRDGVPVVEILKAIRVASTVPVLVLLRSGGVVSELLHFGLGADDVVWMPASARVVAARAARLIRRSVRPGERVTWSVGRLQIDRYQHCVLFDGRQVDVTPLEYRLLAALVGAPGRAFSRNELLEEAMPDSDALERSIDVHIWNLRRKLERVGCFGLLETVRGVGYRMAPPDMALR